MFNILFRKGSENKKNEVNNVKHHPNFIFIFNNFVPFLCPTGCVYAFSATAALCYRLVHRWNARACLSGDYGCQTARYCGGARDVLRLYENYMPQPVE